MNCYIITRDKDGKLSLLCQALIKGKLVEDRPSDNFHIGDTSKETSALARAVMEHYFDAEGDPAAQAEAERKTEKFMHAFLSHHQMPAPGSSYEIPSEVIYRFFSLQ